MKFVCSPSKLGHGSNAGQRRTKPREHDPRLTSLRELVQKNIGAREVNWHALRTRRALKCIPPSNQAKEEMLGRNMQGHAGKSSLGP